MYLYNRERNGKVLSEADFSELPELVWKLQFKQFPVRCAESTPVVDSEGNIYFGSHDGCFYCLSQDGAIKWQFVTESKIYSSPLIVGDNIFFNFGKSNMACLDMKSGVTRWIYDGMDGLRKKSKISRLLSHVISYLHYDYEFKKFMKINAWSSPNILSDGTLITVLCAEGLIALDPESGQKKWHYNPGGGFYHQAGAAISDADGNEKIYFLSQTNGLHVLDGSGKVLWKNKSANGYNGWASPSIDEKEKAVYHSISDHNKSCFLFKHDLDGKLIWKRKFDFGCRAAIGIPETHFIYFLGLNGKVYTLNKKDGSIIKEIKIATSDRGLWTSPAVLKNGNVLINTKKSLKNGSLICLTGNLEVKWEINYGKALSVPFVDHQGYLYSGTWDGDYYKFKERK